MRFFTADAVMQVLSTKPLHTLIMIFYTPMQILLRNQLSGSKRLYVFFMLFDDLFVINNVDEGEQKF